MKSLLLLAATICCACCSCVQPKHYPTIRSLRASHSTPSTPGIRRSSKPRCHLPCMGLRQVPPSVFADSTLNVDYELFRTLAASRQSHPGQTQQSPFRMGKGARTVQHRQGGIRRSLKTVKCTRTADLLWMDDTARLGNVLPRLLRELRYAKREANRYTDFTANAGNS